MLGVSNDFAIRPSRSPDFGFFSPRWALMNTQDGSLISGFRLCLRDQFLAVELRGFFLKILRYFFTQKAVPWPPVGCSAIVVRNGSPSLFCFNLRLHIAGSAQSAAGQRGGACLRI